MLKKFVNMMMVMVLVTMVSMPCYAKEAEIKAFESGTEGSGISPHIVVSYHRSVKVDYPAVNAGSIPQTHYYSEWSEEYDTQCSGTLTMTHSVVVGTKIRVTYEGMLHGRI